MDYLRTLRLNFAGGVTNDYRVRENRVEFRATNKRWRPLDGADVQLHFLLRTDVAKWLLKQSIEMNPHTRPTLKMV